MQPTPLDFFAQACHSSVLNASSQVLIQRVGTDSRATQPGDLFVALAGDHFDGHEFVAGARQQGAAAAMINQDRAISVSAQLQRPFPILVVPDTREALGQIAAAYRAQWQLPIIAVAGSNGKTTTKELLAAVLRQKFQTVASPASFNNDIGVPLTLLSLNRATEAAVLEIGTNHPGELQPLIEMIQPRFGILTSVAREHLEFFGDLDGVAEEESWLGRLLPAAGKLFLNGDSPKLEKILAAARPPAILVGASEKNQWQACHVLMDDHGLQFDVRAPDPAFSGQYRLNLLGRHQAVNALFAIALGHELGLSRQQVLTGLRQCVAPQMRLQLKSGHGFKILDDSYNANADSMRAALETLADFPCSGARVAILGDMAELGASSQAAHAEIGRCAAEAGVLRLFAVGKMAPVMAQAARQAGLTQAREFEASEQAAAAARTSLQPGDVVLVKASRASRLDRVVEILQHTANNT